MKMAILKPVMWNDQGYRRPAGCRSTSGYSYEHGYGHEEWNGNDSWIWRGYRVFHTECTPCMEDVARSGDLGMVMITAHSGKYYAVGVATGVIMNDTNERKAIAEAVGVYDEWRGLWALPTVQRSFKGGQVEFLEHWRKEHGAIKWRCLPEHYYWFPKPVILNPCRVTRKNRLSMRHSKFTQVPPSILLDIIDSHLPSRCSAVREWLASGDFLVKDVASESHAAGSRIHNRILKTRGNAPTGRAFEYWVQGKRTVEPLHQELQSAYVMCLTSKGIDAQEDVDFIDVRYHSDSGLTICEIKPTSNVDTRFAIRTAIGQLLEHRYKQNAHGVMLEIVIGNRPREEEVAFVKSTGLKLTYRAGNGEFVTACDGMMFQPCAKTCV